MSPGSEKPPNSKQVSCELALLRTAPTHHCLIFRQRWKIPEGIGGGGGGQETMKEVRKTGDDAPTGRVRNQKGAHGSACWELMLSWIPSTGYKETH